jgi:adenosylmethionine-8-amino-7-oxononanoate aminotransferase
VHVATAAGAAVLALVLAAAGAWAEAVAERAERLARALMEKALVADVRERKLS